MYEILHRWSSCLRYTIEIFFFQKTFFAAFCCKWLNLFITTEENTKKHNISGGVRMIFEWQVKSDAISWKFTNQWFFIHSKSIYGLHDCVSASNMCGLYMRNKFSELILTFLMNVYAGAVDWWKQNIFIFSFIFKIFFLTYLQRESKQKVKLNMWSTYLFNNEF